MSGFDVQDRIIPTQLRLNARITVQALAQAVGLSSAACLRRVRILEGSGAIRGYTVILGGPAPEDASTAMVQVVLSRQPQDCLARSEAALQEHPEIREWYLMTDEGDHFLRFRIAGIDRDARSIRNALPSAARFPDHLQLRHAKRTTRIAGRASRDAFSRKQAAARGGPHCAEFGIPRDHASCRP